MRIHIIAIHVDADNNIKGFRLLDSDNGQIMDQTYESVKSVLLNKKADIIGVELDKNNGELKGSNGKLTRYPTIFNNSCIQNSIVIINQIDDVGYRVVNWQGKIIDEYSEKLVNYAYESKLANGKLITKDGKSFISAINGNYENIPLCKTSLKINNSNKIDISTKQKRKLLTPIEDTRFPTVISGAAANPSKLKEFDPVSNMTVEQKLAHSMLKIQSMRPFYYTILSLLKRNEANAADNLETMGVTLDSLYFSSDYVLKATLPELRFSLLHEVCHIAMKHRERECGREHDLYNVACDLYINRCLAVDFKLDSKNNTSDEIAIPNFVLYSDKVNVYEDTPESIYEELMQNLNKSGNNSNSGESNNQNGESNNQNNGQNNESNSQNSDLNNSGKGRLSNLEFRGQKLGNTQTDMVNDLNSTGMTPEQISQQNNTLLRQAVTIYKQTHSFGGETGDFLERYVEKALAPKVNWKSVLRKYLTRASQKEYSFSHPDRRFLSRCNSDGSRQVFAGPYKSENNELENIKICIDTSGSITDKDLGDALCQIDDMFKKFKASAELVYWDTKVRGTCEFENVKEILNKKPVGGGGTDAECIFKYFDIIKRKPKPSLIIVFTDGYFGTIDKKYHTKYKNTVWIIHDNESFKAPFGVKAPFKIENK